MKSGKFFTVTALATGITLATFVDSAEAFPFGSKKFPDQLGVQFTLSESSNDIGAIRNFQVIGEDNGETFVAAERESTLGLYSSRYSSSEDFIEKLSNEFSQFSSNPFPDGFVEKTTDGKIVDSASQEIIFDSISGDIYEFRVFSDEKPFIGPVVKVASTKKGRAKFFLPPLLEGSVRWFVPERFTIIDGEFTTSFDLFLNSDPDLPPDESNLAKIFEVADDDLIEEIAFPAYFGLLFPQNRYLAGSQDNLIKFDTTSASTPKPPPEVDPGPPKVPESDTLVGILAIGSLGLIARYRKKIR